MVKTVSSVGGNGMGGGVTPPSSLCSQCDSPVYESVMKEDGIEFKVWVCQKDPIYHWGALW
jgi:hypothetical protein